MNITRTENPIYYLRRRLSDDFGAPLANIEARDKANFPVADNDLMKSFFAAMLGATQAGPPFRDVSAATCVPLQVIDGVHEGAIRRISRDRTEHSKPERDNDKALP